MKYLKVIFLILSTCVLTCLFSACKSHYTQKPLNVDYIRVLNTKQSNLKRFHGFVKSQRTANLSFQSEGRIIYFPFTKGDFVKKGQVLARLDGILYKIQKNEELSKLQEAKIQYDKAKSYYKRMDILHKAGAISDNDWEDAYYSLETNSNQIKIQKERINYLDKEISYNIITAPFDGFIAQKNSDIGAYAKIGEAVLVISGSDKTQVEIMVDSITVNKLNLKETVQVKRLDNKYEGKITHISRSSIESGGFLVKIDLLDYVDSLKDGMSVDVEISLNDTSLVYVPLNCIYEEDGEKFVYKIINISNDIGEIKKEKVTVGEIVNDEIEVLKGVSKDDYLVSSNLDSLENSIKVKL